ncbi:tyrosine-type recombinase/integrase [Rhizobium sp. WW_1]|jgi:integrase|uniref:tyrosine-type recombinase/integrase n=1 Tax=Rhizobium sp. WW_1 TaxID=1907375 RepID=UPI0006488131|nr:tyrosine-type recombinase/integrase [Rhizobium sp. WW_1]RKD52206.1 phage integrase family protein [Rhizobium sp. WW_1]
MTEAVFQLEPIVLEEITRLSIGLPPLPPTIRYFDDFENELRSIRNLADSALVAVRLDGTSTKIDFTHYRPGELILKHVFVDFLSRLDPHSVALRYGSLQRYVLRRGITSLLHLIAATPFDARSHWNTSVLSDVSAVETWALRALLHSLCRLNIGHWSPPATSIIRGLKSPKVDRYRVVRAGDCFLPLDQQAMIINHIDSMCGKLAADPAALEHDELRDVCMLVMSFQYAFRPGQIARIELADVRLFSTGAVHVAVSLIKQQDNSKRIRITRKVKREWGPLFNELVKRREAGTLQPEEGVPPRLLFGLTPSGVSRAIMELTEELTGDAWSPTDLRHTAAQRLADGGISHAGLTEFMGQTSDRIANVYFDTSPAQAQRINEALAISPIYSNLAKIAKTKTIDKVMLLGLPSDQQIGAVPHGVPIAGIGGCGLGQSLCTKNPVLACYTCSQFMPLGEPEIHEEVLESFRPVVVEFASASRNNQQSPAYGQLKGTLDAVRRVVEELRANQTGEDRE